ncbi:MAG: LPS export ABC transporter periplasmic protein LptC [Mariprofundus sp.]|nr:LPS export ABC transporter periplasmic protein LptC [Mariprofundus sp.]
MQTQAWHSLKWISLTVSLGSIAIVVVLLQSGGPQQAASAKAEEEPQTQVESPVIVERKDGKITWQLRAEEASQQLDGKMHLIKPTLVLYTENGKTIKIQSRQAWFEAIQRNVRFKDHVMVFYDDWTMQSELMIYDSGKDEMHVPGTFKLWGKTIKAHGKNMRLHRATEEINVEDGIWIEDTDAQWQGVSQ